MPEISASRQVRTVVSLNGLALLVLGFVPGELIRICTSVLGF